MANIISALHFHLAPRTTVHGVLVEVHGEGLLLTGDSGIGKSETALELIKRGHRLIADDAVDIRKLSKGSLVGSAPELIRYYMELRGIGVVDVRHIYGVGAVKPESAIDLVVNMEIWDGIRPTGAYERNAGHSRRDCAERNDPGASGQEPCGHFGACRNEQPSEEDGLQRRRDACGKSRPGDRPRHYLIGENDGTA